MRLHKRSLSLLLCIVVLTAVVIGLAPQANAASKMSVSKAFVDVLKKMEGFSALAYWDYSQWTVGYGTQCPADKLEEYKTKGITEEEALKLLDAELDRFEADVNGFASKHGLTLKQQQFDALVSFSYNCGSSWMSETTGYFNTAVRDADMGGALLYGMGLFSTAGGQYSLIQRRLCEANMYINGVYKAYNSGDNGIPANFKWVFLDGNGGQVRYKICVYDAKEAAPVNVAFENIPVGKDASGQPFIYTLAGWYTADGKKVDALDFSLTNGQTLYARWADPEGNIQQVQPGETIEEMKVTVNNSNVNIRSGPGTEYAKVGVAQYGDVLTLTAVQQGGGYTWGKWEKGWICLDYTDYAQQIAQKKYPKYGVVNASDVNYRTEPVISSSTLVGKKQKGDAVTIVEEKKSGSTLWGKMSDGYWISLDYVTFDGEQTSAVTDVTLVQLPKKLRYRSMSESLKLEGSILRVQYADGKISAKTLTREMVTAYEKTGDDTAQVTATYQGKKVTFQVGIGQYTVTFLDWDGTVLSRKYYDKDAQVTAPEAPERAADETYTYTFQGWDKPVAACTEDAVYTAVYTSAYVEYAVMFLNADGSVIATQICHYGDQVQIPEAPERPASLPEEAVFRGWTPEVTICTQNQVYRAIFSTSELRGDFNGDFLVSDADAIYLLRHILLPDRYPAAQSADVNADGQNSDADAIYLLRHVLLPDRYPLADEAPMG